MADLVELDTSTCLRTVERLARQIEQGVRDVAPTLKEVGKLIPQGEFFKYVPIGLPDSPIGLADLDRLAPTRRWVGQYNKGLQDLTFLAALAHFLLYSSLISLTEVSDMLAVRGIVSLPACAATDLVLVRRAA